MRFHVKLDKDGVGRIAKSPTMRTLIKKLADEVAENVQEQGITVGAFSGGGKIPLPVAVKTRVTDRARAEVVLAHPAGIAVQAKHGALTKAASAAGLKVKDS